jgi:hypothetical protein
MLREIQATMSKHTTVTRSSKSWFSSTSAPASNIRAQSAFFKPDYLCAESVVGVTPLARVCSEPIIVTLIAGAFMVVAGRSQSREPSRWRFARPSRPLFASRPP